jgi:uncharacterized Zn-binding protein involved in type VI secretion
MGQPAARVSDMHVCPAFDGPKPHVGGPVLPPCLPTVLSVAMPQARVMDMATCVGPPDFIAQGSSTVLVGGLPGSRMLDTTSHGGVITTGGLTVLIGGPPVTLVVAPGQSPAFVAQLQANLARIFVTPSGQAFLNQMAANGRTITFRQGGPGENTCTPTGTPGTAGGGPPGSDSTIAWDPNTTSLNGFDPSVANCGADTILFHEMVHGLHNANGAHGNGPNESFGQGGGGTSQRGEERATVGTSPNVTQPGGTTRPVQEESPPPPHNAPAAQQTDHSGNVPTENSYRRDQGLPPRPSYFPTNWPGGPPW